MTKWLKPTVVGLVAIFFVAVLHYIGWIKPVENLLIRAVSPVQERAYSLSLGIISFKGDWLTKRDLLAENKSLRGQLIDFQMDLSRINSLQEENDLLKQELNFVKESGHKYVSAKIITGVSDPLSESVIINRGSSDGIAKGLAVVTGGGIMVGKVSEVQSNFSKVLLLTDNKSKVAATIQNINHTAGLVEGQFGLSFAMTNIPQDEPIKPGDLVVTSGLEGQIPKNLLIAKIERVDKIESEIFKTAILDPIVPLGNLSDVLIIIP